MLKKVKIIGIPLWLYAIIGVILMAAVYAGALPNEMIGSLAMCIYWGSLFMYIGDRIPIVNSYMGGKILLPLVACSLMTSFHIIPDSTRDTLKSLMSGGFQNLYIAALIVGSILSMNRKTLIKAVAKYMPCIIASQFCAIGGVALATLIVRKDLFDGLFMVGLPCMAGGSGSAITTLPTMYTSMMDIDYDQVSSALLAVLMVSNILAIILGSLMNKLGKIKPSWTGNGNILMDTSGESAPAEDEKKDKKPMKFNLMACGLLCICMFYIGGNLISKLPYLGKIHMLAWTIILVCIIKVADVLPEDVTDGCNTYYNYMMQNLLPGVVAGIGFTAFDLTTAASALANPANLFIVVVGIFTATISAMIVGRLIGLYPIETGISVGLCSCNLGGSGDLAVLMAADRMNLLPFASISTRIGGALMLVWISLLMPLFL